jgi:hypothetical protein
MITQPSPSSPLYADPSEVISVAKGSEVISVAKGSEATTVAKAGNVGSVGDRRSGSGGSGGNNVGGTTVAGSGGVGGGGEVIYAVTEAVPDTSMCVWTAIRCSFPSASPPVCCNCCIQTVTIYPRLQTTSSVTRSQLRLLTSAPIYV